LQLFAAVSSSVRYQSIRIDSAEGESLLILSFDLIEFLYDDAVNSFRFFMQVAKPPESFHPRLGVFSALGAYWLTGSRRQAHEKEFRVRLPLSWRDEKWHREFPESFSQVEASMFMDRVKC
jgi:hypothetical protein